MVDWSSPTEIAKDGGEFGWHALSTRRIPSINTDSTLRCLLQVHALSAWTLPVRRILYENFIEFRPDSHYATLLVGSSSSQFPSISTSSSDVRRSSGLWYVFRSCLSSKCHPFCSLTRIRIRQIFYFAGRYSLLFALIGMYVSLPIRLEDFALIRLSISSAIALNVTE